MADDKPEDTPALSPYHAATEKGKHLFKAGNPGRPKGSINKKKAEFAALCAQMLDENFASAIQLILEKGRPDTILKLLVFWSHYAVGRPLQGAAIGGDNNTALPDVFAELMRQAQEEAEKPSGGDSN
jgi:hypothetical protein